MIRSNRSGGTGSRFLPIPCYALNLMRNTKVSVGASMSPEDPLQWADLIACTGDGTYTPTKWIFTFFWGMCPVLADFFLFYGWSRRILQPSQLKFKPNKCSVQDILNSHPFYSHMTSPVVVDTKSGTGHLLSITKSGYLLFKQWKDVVTTNGAWS